MNKKSQAILLCFVEKEDNTINRRKTKSSASDLRAAHEREQERAYEQ
jgi:hypothetical protein